MTDNPLEALAKHYRLDPDLVERLYFALEPYQPNQDRVLALTVSVARAIAGYRRSMERPPSGGHKDLT